MKKIFVLLFLEFFLHSYCFSQDKQLVDSLQSVLQNIKKDTTKANILFSISKAYWGSDFKKAIAFAEECLTVSQRSGYEKGAGMAYNSLGVIEIKRGNYITAMEFHKKALTICESAKDKNGIAFARVNMGNIYWKQGNPSEALKNYFSSLKINEAIHDKEGMGLCYNNIGLINFDQGNFNEALKNTVAALHIFKEINDKKYIISTYNNLGEIYRVQGKYNDALKSYFTSLTLAKEIGDKYHIGDNYNSMGEIYREQLNYDEALKSYFSSLKIKEEIGDKDGISISYINIGEVYTIQHKYSDALEYLNKGLDFSKEIGNLDNIKKSYINLSALNNLEGKDKDALVNYKLYIVYRDSLLNNENSKVITQQQMQFAFDRKQVADSLQFAQEKEIGLIKLQKQTALTYGGLTGIVIAIILLFLVYNNYKKQRSANKQLKEAQSHLIKSEKMAAFGLMASRVSHEIQNPLNFVNNFSELSLEMLTELSSSVSEEDIKVNTILLAKNLQKINEQGKRAAEIIKQLQEHSRKGSAHEFFEENQN
jgi:tetratricopeptide (TPR) repeat protein